LLELLLVISADFKMEMSENEPFQLADGSMVPSVFFSEEEH